jgi:transposase
MQAFWNKLMNKLGGEIQPIRVVLEATTNARAGQQLVTRTARAADLPIQADVVDPRKIRLIAESVIKTDALDAKVLCELARSNFALPLCYLPDDEEFALREHLRARNDLVRLRTMLKNRVHAVLHRRGILRPQDGLFTASGRAFLEDLELDSEGREILERFLAMIDQLDAALAASERALRNLQQRTRWQRSSALLQSMPGIGLVTALTILAELGDLARFRSRAAVANYAGLTPRVRLSDGKGYLGSTTRRGSAHLRQMLCEAAWIAVRKVPCYQALFERVSGRRGKQIAIVAVARRMLEDGFVMLKRAEPFRFVSPPTAADTTRIDREVVSSVAG